MANLRLFVRAGALATVMLILIGAGSCPLNFEAKLFDKIFTKFQSEIEAELGFTIHVLYPALGDTDVIVPDTPGGYPDTAPKLECSSWCVLAMLDLQPRAHFAHPVILMVYDLRANRITSLPTEWWPFNETTGERYFHTVKERRKTLVCRPGYDCFGFFPPDDPRWSVDYSLARPPSPAGFAIPNLTVPVWAVIVNGYDDEDDSFDEDTDGMYQVLRGLGVEDHSICYLTDQRSIPGRDSIARRELVEDALKYVTLMTGGGDGGADPRAIRERGEAVCGEPPDGRVIVPSEAKDVLLFYSSHGSFDPGTEVTKVLCNHFKDTGLGYITDADFLSWLSPVKAKRMTVVIEACHSEGFLDELAPGLTHENVTIFVSSAKDKSSYADVDPDDDKNPGDAGSETIWGFIEAFGTSSADALCETGGPCDDQDVCTKTGGCVDCADDGQISFEEAVCYAQLNDASPGVHESKTFFKQPNAPTGTYLGAETLHPTTLEVAHGPQSERTTTSAGGDTLSLIKRNRFNNIELRVKNTGDTTLGVATVRLHIEQEDETEIKDWDHAPTLILPRLAGDDVANLSIRLREDGDLANEELVTLKAGIDSPQSPEADNQAAQIKTGAAQAVTRFGSGSTGGCRSVGGG